MILQKHLLALQQYAATVNPLIKVEAKDNRVIVYKGDSLYINLSNKVSSQLTMKTVKHHIDNAGASLKTNEAK